MSSYHQMNYCTNVFLMSVAAVILSSILSTALAERRQSGLFIRRATDTAPGYVRKFAPELRHDRAAKGYPMSAQKFYDAMREDDSSTFRLENTDRSTLRSGTIPVYYRVETEEEQTRINYWWFYGYQHPCMFNLGSHNGDWEHIMVVLNEDKSAIAAVSFYQHNNHYTRIAGPRDAPCTPSGTGRCSGSRGFHSSSTHPIVYVGKIGHGSYHNDNSGGPGGCGYYDDFRNPSSRDDYMEGWNKLVDLDGNAESWLASDRNENFPWGFDGVNTHPTRVSPFNSEHSMACEGSATYAAKSAGCYHSECLAGDDETASKCFKECKRGYKNVGLTCNKGVLPWQWKIYGRLDGGNSYSYSYTLPKTDVGLTRRRKNDNEWDLP